MSNTLVSIIGGLTAMLGWGVSDFYASEASDKVGHNKTLFWSQIAGLALMAVAVILFAGDFVVTGRLFALMIISGIAYTFGYLLFYKGFELGNVSVVSAVVNTQQVFVILISFFIFHQTLTKYQIPALLLILVGITLVSVNFKDLKSGNVALVKGVKETLLAAVMFGVVFWPLNEYITERADWIMASFITKIIAILTLLVISTVTKRELRIKRPSKRLKVILVAVGLLEAIAVLGMSFGVSLGDAIIVSPIAGSLTIVTVSMAVFILKEKITKTQGLGILLTIVGIVLTGF